MGAVLNDEEQEKAFATMLWKMDDPEIRLLDGFSPSCFGLDLPERLMWEAFVTRQDISHKKGWDTGRPSEPAFMDMNLHSTRSEKLPKSVVWQFDANNPMNPRGLLVAYEEEQVLPVVSDFDPFLIGTRGVTFKTLPHDQVSLVRWCLAMIEEVLGDPQPLPWTSRWLQVLKKESDKGFHPEIPKYGFGDETTYGIIDTA